MNFDSPRLDAVSKGEGEGLDETLSLASRNCMVLLINVSMHE